MKPSRLPTLTEFDQLTAFLQVLYAEGFKPILKVNGGDKDENGVITFPWPDYDSAVIDFFNLAAQDCWTDHEYVPSKEWKILEDPKAVQAASLAEIKSLLTYCVRGERFCDGRWAAMIEKGYIRQILERLVELRKQVDEIPE